jgi:aminoglycoside 6'-N-acetyltransferase I
MRVVRLKRSQIPEWLKLRSALWPAVPSDEHRRAMTDLLSDEEFNAVFVGVDRRGRLVGFVEVSLRMNAEGCATSPVGYVEGLYVIPEGRRKGSGRALVAKAEAWASSQGCREMAADADVDNVDGRRAQRGLGYEEVARLAHFRKSLLPNPPSR